MIRIAIRAWICCLTSLTVLPGCQLFSPFRGEQPGPVKDERVLISPDNHNKAEDKSTPLHNIETKSIANPSKDIDPLPRENWGNSITKVDLPAIPPIEGATAASHQAPAPLSKELDKEKREYAPLVKALQCILDGRHEEGIEHLKVYDERTQEFLIQLLPTFTIFVRKGLDDMSAQEVAVLNNQLIGLLATLRPRSELLIDKICFCRSVRGFGAYDALPANHAFLSATKDRPGELVQLYVELKNFASEAGKDGDYLTKLVCSLELQNAKGEKVWAHTYDRKDTTHPRRTRLNDFFSNYSFYVPELPMGEYKLTIHVVDETIPTHQRRVSRSLSFRVTPVLNHTTLR
jgi:hypothetical protein